MAHRKLSPPVQTPYSSQYNIKKLINNYKTDGVDTTNPDCMLRILSYILYTSNCLLTYPYNTQLSQRFLHQVY